MYISYDYYRIFYYVAKYGNLSQAQSSFLNNQPNMSRAPSKTWKPNSGVPLFLRTNRGMKLTPEGERLYAHVRIAFEHIEAGEAEITESRTLQTGTVYVAASEVALRCLLLPVLKEFRLLHPRHPYPHRLTHSTPQAIAALKGWPRILPSSPPPPHRPPFTETPVRPIHEYAVCSPFFKTLTNRQVKLEELLEFPLISLGADANRSSSIPGSSPRTGFAVPPGYRSVHCRPNFAHGRSRPRHRVRAGRILGKMVKCLSHRFGRENTGKKRRREKYVGKKNDPRRRKVNDQKGSTPQMNCTPFVQYGRHQREYGTLFGQQPLSVAAFSKSSKSM